MQIKSMIVILGMILLCILLLGRLWIELSSDDGETQDFIHIPKTEKISNVWIVDVHENEISVFLEGVENKYKYKLAADEQAVLEDLQNQIADVVITDNVITAITLKTEKINGVILSADAEGIEIEGYGELPLAKDYKGYRIYNTLAMCTVADIPFGYNYTDLVLDNGEVCAVLLAKDAAMDHIRVLIKGSDYNGTLHEEIVLSADSDYSIQYGTSENPMIEERLAGEELVVNLDSEYLSGNRMIIQPKVLTGKVLLKNVNRSQGTPAYRGHIELIATEDGIVVINDVLLEEYLYSVVPSEMPSSYPIEALKAQAVCARTYAYGHMMHAGYSQYGAHVDDSTSYQVYNNIAESSSTTRAVKETYGKLLYTPDNQLATTYYYSTSCGVGSDANVWKSGNTEALDYLKAQQISKYDTGQVDAVSIDEEFCATLTEEESFAEFITNKNVNDFEAEEGWYRWTYQVDEIDLDKMLEKIQNRFDANNQMVLTYVKGEFVSKKVKKLDSIERIFVAKRGAGGVADELVIWSGDNIYMIISEYNIRYVLNDGVTKVTRQDGSEVEMSTLLPSGFFIIEPTMDDSEVVGYTLRGGGFGHGVGMSQNAAKQMAKEGFTADNILLFFYDGCSVQNVYEQ